MMTETRKRRNYTEDFKRDAVALVTEQGYKRSQAAGSLGIGENLTPRWKREFEKEASGAQLGADGQMERPVSNPVMSGYFERKPLPDYILAITCRRITDVLESSVFNSHQNN